MSGLQIYKNVLVLKKQCLAFHAKQVIVDIITHQKWKDKLRTRQDYIMVSLSVHGL